ncbi:MAG: toll/interleukin-1 receptor domain-containing protein [Deltaproteobacteria bacterium]|nr:toll/interleukin-1 receptor domain-containing protein [Deltaproteobacteria bacterium]
MQMNLPIGANDFWEDLLDFVEQGKVIPVVGEHAVTFGEHNELLYPWLARELATRLNVNGSRLAEMPTLNDVAREHLLAGGERNAIYTRLARILREKCPAPGGALHDLASIDPFNLYLSTTFDPLLERALNCVRFDGAEATRTQAFFPGAANKDLPARRTELSGVTVYHVLGKMSVAAGEFVAWEEDLLDFLCELPRHLSTDVMKHLSSDLKSHALLLLGLNFSDWLTRLFLRVSRQDPLSRVTLASWLADGPPGTVAQSMVMFFGGVNRSIKIVECDPAAFVSELVSRWRERHPTPVGSAAFGTATGPRGLAFISYVREDENAARSLADGLKRYGCEVYLDLERLGPGINYHFQLEDQVKKYCGLFLSVISPATERALGDNYFLRERYWASQRAEGYSDAERSEFYLPVVIHPVRPSEIRQEPRIFSGCQWNHLPCGVVTPTFGSRVADLQRKYRCNDRTNECC